MTYAFVFYPDGSRERAVVAANGSYVAPAGTKTVRAVLTDVVNPWQESPTTAYEATRAPSVEGSTDVERLFDLQARANHAQKTVMYMHRGFGAFATPGEPFGHAYARWAHDKTTWEKRTIPLESRAGRGLSQLGDCAQWLTLQPQYDELGKFNGLTLTRVANSVLQTIELMLHPRPHAEMPNRHMWFLRIWAGRADSIHSQWVSSWTSAEKIIRQFSAKPVQNAVPKYTVQDGYTYSRTRLGSASC